MSYEKKLLVDLNAAKAELVKAKEAKTNAEWNYNNAEAMLIDYLDDADKKATAKYDDIGYGLSVKPRLYASVIKEKEEELFTFLRKNERGDLIKTVVNAGSLSTFAKERVEAGLRLPNCISYYLQQKIRIYNKTQ